VTLEKYLLTEIERLSREINHLKQEIAMYEKMLRKLRRQKRN
jgi:hypothetical protein